VTKDQIREHFKNRYNTFYEKYLPPENKIRKIGGHEYQTLCPFHEDTKPSFNINSDTGEYFCHGCNKKGNAFHFYAKINDLDNRRDFPKILKGIAIDFGINIEETKLRFVKAYDYRDIDGSLLFQVCRYEPKTFKQRIPDGNGYKYGLNGVKPVLYRLPEIVKATDVLIVEGEKDADNLHALGFNATTSPMGAKKWRSEYSDYLKDKEVILIPDNDNEGREHMAQVGAALRDIAKTLKWIDLPDVPSKGDISDWIKNFQTKEDAAERLSIMIESAKPYDPPVKQTIENIIIEASDFLKLDLPPKRKILDIISEQEIVLLSGWRGTGKTWAALSIVDAITRGASFGPWKVRTPVPCLYCDGEMAAPDIQTRLNTLNPDPKRITPLYIYSDAYANLQGIPKANLLSETWRSTMKRILTTRAVKFWVIDNIASLAPGIDENKKDPWDPINAWLLDLRFAGITTTMLHHTNKEGGQRGTSAREDNIDMSIILKHQADYCPDDGVSFNLHFSKARLPFEDLSFIQECSFKFTPDKNGLCKWTWGNVKQEKKQEVIEMLTRGNTYSEISKTLGITPGYITKIKKAAIKDGIIDTNLRLIED
jgi:hypothetical protein